MSYDRRMIRPFAATSSLSLLIALVLFPAAGRSQESPPPVEAIHRPFDQLLDLQVRDGLVYYRALKSVRGSLDRYVASLNVPAAAYDAWSKEQRAAFWLNAYNAFVLRTVVDHYPIRARATTYPANSIRQIPGAFDQIRHRAAGRAVTLDEIEKTILPEFQDPRLYLAIGRGALGGGRLRSEAYSGGRLEAQLGRLREEFVTNPDLFKIDRAANQIGVTPVVGWHEAAFVAAYDRSSGAFAERSPVERAILAFVEPHLFPTEKVFVQKNAFRIVYQPFDWRLNDLTGGNPR
jgi:hypothetical protein